MPVRRALDVGCGAGLSTRALQALARECLGVDPAPAMVTCAASVVPEARFQVARAEALPLASASIDLMAAAGSLNYMDLDQFSPRPFAFLSPVARCWSMTLARVGPAANGRNWRPGFADSKIAIPFRPMAGGSSHRGVWPRAIPRLPLVASEHFEIGVSLTLDGYVNYLLTESNLAQAIARGATTSELRDTLNRELKPLFGDGSLQVLLAIRN